MGKLVADIIVETLQSAGVRHCYGVVGDTLNLIARSLDNPRSLAFHEGVSDTSPSSRYLDACEKLLACVRGRPERVG